MRRIVCPSGSIMIKELGLYSDQRDDFDRWLDAKINFIAFQSTAMF